MDAAGNVAKDADGNNVASTTTDAAGKYEFTNLKPGVQYVVEFTKPAGYEPTSKDKGTDDTKDSDATNDHKPKKKTKPELTPERFLKAIEAVKSGDFTKEELQTKYNLKEVQINKLNEL